MYLIIDQGGQSTRAVLFDHSGKILARERRPIATRRSAPDRVEHDCDELLASVHDTIDALLPRIPAASGPIPTGLVTQRSSLVCWRRTTGEPLTPVISWQDTRGKSLLENFEAQRDDIKARTGLVVNVHYGASKILWCLENVPAVKMAQATGELAVGPLAAFLVFKLTGQFKVDPANGSRTLLMNIHSNSWDDHLLARATSSRHSLPEICDTRDDYGFFVRGEHRFALRLVNGDQSAAFNSYGSLRDDTVYINAGSGAFIACVKPPRVTAPQNLLLSPVYCEAGVCQLLCEGTVNGAANALEYQRQALALQDYGALDDWHGDYDSIPLFLNGIGGLGSPFWNADFDSEFIGAGDARQKMLAVLESIAFLLILNLQALQAAGISLTQIYLSGGLSRFALLTTRLQQLSGLPVYLADDSEATARGAAFQLAGFPRDWSLPAMTRHQPGPLTALDDGVAARFRCWQQEMAARLGT
ncbi:MAG: FGGY family carbohydrate kinase [Porticoccaceae bacterium]